MAHALRFRASRRREEERNRQRVARSILLRPPSDDDDDNVDEAVAAVDLDSKIWSQLPANLVHRVLGWLPLQSLVRFRCVCKPWKALFASPGFHHFPSRTNLAPWIFLFGNGNGGYDYGYGDSRSYAHGSGSGSVNSRGYGYGYCRGYGDVEDLLLSFDYASASWLPSVPIPSGFFQDSFSRDSICSLRGQLLIATSAGRLYVCNPNPITPSRKELPPFISIQRAPLALAFAEDACPGSTPNPSSITLAALKHLSVIPTQSLQPSVQDKGDNVQVVAVGASHNGTLVVENFHSSTGSWEVCGYLPSYLIFSQPRMVECNGFLYALLHQPRGMLIISSIRRGEDIEWTRQEPPKPTNRDGDLGDPPPKLHGASLVVCRNSVFMIGATSISLYGERQGGILIWRFHPDGEDAWQLHVAMPRAIYDKFYGGAPLLTPHCCAHGDLIFFQYPGMCRILVYDVSQDSWRHLPKCKYNMQSFAFVWEPLLIT